MRKLTFIICLFSLTNMNAQTTPCNCCSEKHAEFDFWIGDWEVTNPDGSIAGTNTITKSQSACLLQENWVSANGKVTGTSNNFYNSKTKQWEQIWVDNMGESLHLKGNRIGNQMILKSDPETNRNGEPFYNRITWTLKDDGSVVQFWETITNDSEIKISFDGLYRKKE